MNDPKITLTNNGLGSHEEDYECDSVCDNYDDEDTINEEVINLPNGDVNSSVAVCDPTKLPFFKSVSVVNSNDVHFGNKTIYQGPVTIKQFVYPDSEIFCETVNGLKKNVVVENAELKKSKSGVDNPGFVNSEKGFQKSTQRNHVSEPQSSSALQRIKKGISVL